MAIKGFKEIMEMAEATCREKRAVIANAADQHAMSYLTIAGQNGMSNPVLTGDKGKISNLLKENGLNPGDFEIVHCTKEEAAQKSVEIVNAGEADFLIKGMLETSDFLRPIVKKENGMRTGRAMSYQAIFEIPGYKKILLYTDGGMIPYPDLEKKKQILKNAIQTFHALGYERPKAAVLCCKETPDEKLPETMDAFKLHQLSGEGYFENAEVDGPLSYDICMDPVSAEAKHFDCPNSGDYDILMPPNIHATNILVKAILFHTNAVSAGLISGCRVPVVASSRGARPEEMLYTAAVATLIAKNKS